MSGRSKVVSDKTEFLNFQPDKCPVPALFQGLRKISPMIEINGSC